MHRLTRGLLTLAIVHFVNGYNILVIPFPWESHYKQMEFICTRLQERGHRITVVIPKTESYASTISLEKIVYDVSSLANDTLLSVANRRIVNSEGFYMSWVLELLTIQKTLTVKLLEDQRVLKAAKEANFVITDTASMGTLAAIDYFNLPFFAISPWGLQNGLFSNHFGIPGFPSYIPNFALYSYFQRPSASDEMDICERMLNLGGYLFHKLYQDTVAFLYFYELQGIYQKNSITTMYKKTSLVLVPMDFAVEYPIPLPPHVKMIGPLTVSEGDPLTKDFNHILARSSCGTVVVNYGGTLALPEGWLEKMTEYLLSLDENVIWRFRRKIYLEHLRKSRKEFVLVDQSNRTKKRKMGTPASCDEFALGTCPKDNTFGLHVEDKDDYLVVEDRLYIFDWIPQNDLLSHPKVVVFMSHCGTNSVYESVYHQVPQICSPLFGDHWDMAGRVKSRQLGKVITWDEMNLHLIKQSIQELKSSSKIRASLALTSRRLKNRKRSSVDEAADILETYMEYGDSSFLRPRGADMNFIELYCLDIAFIVIFVVYVLSVGIRRTIRLFTDNTVVNR